jgi:uncharacterized protein (DUF736 family)
MYSENTLTIFNPNLKHTIPANLFENDKKVVILYWVKPEM